MKRRTTLALAYTGQMPLRVLLITEYFWPDEAGTGRYLGDLLQELDRQRGDLEFEVLTSRRLYRTSGPRTLPARDTLPGMNIRRIRSLRRGQDGSLRRSLADLAFSARAVVAVLRTSADCALVVTNPPVAPLLVAPVARLRGLPFAYLIHDLYPDVPVALGLWLPGSRYARLLRRVQHRTIHSACKVVVLGRCMEAYLARRYGVGGDQVMFIPHWPTLALPAPSAQWTAPSTGAFRVLYSGNLGRFQDFETLLSAAEQLLGEPRIQFRLCGRGAREEGLRQEIARRRLTNVTVEDFLDEEAFREELGHTQFGVVTLEPQLEGIGVPSKTYNLLAAGVPICAVMGDASEVAQVIEEYGCGIRVDHGDSAALAEAIAGLQRDEARWREMSAAGRRYVRARGSLPLLAARYRRVLEECAKS